MSDHLSCIRPRSSLRGVHPTFPGSALIRFGKVRSGNGDRRGYESEEQRHARLLYKPGFVVCFTQVILIPYFFSAVSLSREMNHICRRKQR